MSAGEGVGAPGLQAFGGPAVKTARLTNQASVTPIPSPLLLRAQGSGTKKRTEQQGQGEASREPYGVKKGRWVDQLHINGKNH